jgi:hypothetical protein
MPAAVADGVWRLTLGRPLKINVFLIREGDGVAIFDSATKPPRQAADPASGVQLVDRARPRSIAKLAALEPRTCWPGRFAR